MVRHITGHDNEVEVLVFTDMVENGFEGFVCVVGHAAFRLGAIFEEMGVG